MHSIKVSVLAILTILLAGCATSEKEVPTDHLSSGPNIIHHNGTVTNIREVKKDASLGRQIEGSMLGALVGGQIGGGSTQSILGSSGAFIGQDIMNEKYGEVVDRLILTSDDGIEFQCLVHGHDFRVGDTVVFTTVSDHVSAIIQAN
ncbi:MAG: hypothetical protein ACR2QW_20120 [bacterium]